jgi:hypothetical protein
MSLLRKTFLQTPDALVRECYNLVLKSSVVKPFALAIHRTGMKTNVVAEEDEQVKELDFDKSISTGF